ncbi:MAG: hypothetical protein FJ088_03290, partial [Deltaproteobacteria bacterium]|nr:hypothetical protein [Deltaproteobacteria bacterium]
WCFSPENDYKYGDGWNKEDFSIIGPDGKPRGEKAFSRPYPRALSGKPVSMRFYSDYHYFDPDKGIVNPLHEFELKFESKETDAPTEIFVPEMGYPDGFYLYLTDGYAVYDQKEQILYYFPSEDAPGQIHGVTIKAPLAGQVHKGWNYFFYKDMAVDGK